MEQEVVDELGGSSRAPTTRRITVEAGPDAVMKLKYHVPITGTHRENCSFLIECDLPDSMSKLFKRRVLYQY